MQLSRLEIKGFKSFGDKVTINFDKGITGIVGPNGCGKSNVVDSIRWVLGEQKTRALRSDKMENVIFNGTKNRKPTQLAEVSLTFNNTKNLLPTEYSQVTITRRYYRSGESEYLLNGVTCRLKDITGLFLDTGIASNSYAIIELKMVDDILNDKDGSRRTLFEEAAGISKFKTRKKETLKKLEDTDADLNRVDDLLFEIEKNLKSLERQAKQTERYMKLKEEYKVLSIELAIKSVSQFTEAFLSLTKQLEGESDKKISVNKQVAEVEAHLEKLKTELITKEKNLASRQKTLNDHINKIRHYESEKKIKNERLRYLTDRVAALREQIEADKQSNDRASSSIKGLMEEKMVAEKLYLETEAKVSQLQQEFESQKQETNSLQQQTAEITQTQRSAQEQVYSINKSLEIKQIQLSSLKQEIERTASDTQEQSASLARFDEMVKELSGILNERNTEVERLQQAELSLQQRIEQTEKTLESIREEASQTARKLDARQNEFNLTKSLVENLEGFPEAIKFLRKNADWGKDAPLLSDILTCDESYRVTIENYLEPFMNYYIVDTEAQAYQAVNLLSNAAKGKAHFFVLDSFEKFSSTPAKLFSNAIPATEIVEFDPKYRKLIGYILDKVYIAASDNDIPKEDDCIFITKSGKVTKRKFSISGGSVGLFEGKRIGRAKNLEKLEVEIKQLSKKITEIKDSQESKQRELQQLKASTQKTLIEGIQKEINQINQEYISIKTKQEQFMHMLTSASNKREDMQAQIATLSSEIDNLRPQAEQVKERLSNSESQLAELNQLLYVANEKLSQKSTAYNQQNILYHQHQNKVNSLEQELAYKQNAFDMALERIQKNQTELKLTDEEVRVLIERNESSDDELIAMYAEKDAIEIGVNEAEKEYYQSRGDIDTAEKQLREIQRSKESSDTIIMELQNKINETKLQMSSVKERLNVEFNLDMEELMAEENPELRLISGLAEPELRQKVSEIRASMDRIGPINPMAMEAYQEIKERNDFITAQKEDLVKAKESLMTTISEIDSVARTTFLEAFALIKENFIKVFRSLFTDEDDCDLRLADPDNPLETDIEIMAKPKGKRPLTINQLSGGEKTLTAISLLFSIYLLKPAPFCIFDEVDAPLDDANIDKFNNIIKKFSNDSQFIIVTHNKRTMASTDIIYGITMIEQGVSRVVPVDLRELAE
ncbi:chromosome segregation protein SMC [Cytophagales bacterium LB-30]|uniref:Chromosome partition protein Smc n=1 Tax=Shiella aurantiaca TaxID=3058365 RepID=A0ABT8F4M4_9BACT|nr:chromosome segregation protein SMC [Shiella aurantiaca]MDN4165338.1 chromosome segregation protein SMC [Shiella aurantiaca]